MNEAIESVGANCRVPAPSKESSRSPHQSVVGRALDIIREVFEIWIFFFYEKQPILKML